MKNSYLIAFFAIAFYYSDALAQQQITNNLKFESGVYLSFEAFKNNTPDYTWEDARASAYVNDEKYVAQVEYVKILDSVSNEFVNKPLSEIWGICVNGVPYIRIFNKYKSLTQFAGLKTRGKLCYFTIEGHIIHEIPMTVYDPRTGKAVGSKNIENKEDVLIGYLLAFDSGVIHSFTVDNLRKLIADDTQLTETLRTLSSMEAKEKLYKTMLIYNDRNPIFLK